MLTMNSSRSSAAASRSLLGVESTGLPGRRDERADLTGPLGLDLLGQHHDGILPEHLREPAHTGVSAAHAEALPLARRAASRRAARGGQREHRAAGTIEVPGHDVDDVDQPRGERAEVLGADADASVHGGGRGAGELTGESADRRRLDTTRVLDALGREARGQRLEVRPAVDPRPDVIARVGEALRRTACARSP